LKEFLMMTMTRKSPALILVVDDDWMNREVMEAHLQGAGYEVMIAHSGDKALELAFSRPPDLVLLDVRMHGLGGYEVCRRLKNHEATRFAPVVMVTALESDEDKLMAIEAGADDFISKPFNSLMLITRVRNLLRIKSLHDELEASNNLLRRVLNRFVNEDITEAILADPDKNLKLGGETRPVTVLFADIRGFTAFAEQRRAEDVLALLNQFFNELTEVIVHHHGTLDKYMGDEIMAFFGAPLASDDDVLNAVQSAWQMHRVFERIKRDLAQPELQALGLGIGLHTGDAAVGNVGSERVMSYTVIGDTVNTARRIQQNAGSGQTLISEAIYRQVSALIKSMPLQPLSVKGKRDPLVIYSVTGVNQAEVKE
jgi:adenylate cyclase